MSVRTLTLAAAILCFAISCQKGIEDPGPDPDPNPNPNPPGNQVQLAITSISPTHGAGGTDITIYGTGFSTVTTNNTIQINGKPATVVSAKDTSLVVTIPVKAGSGAVTVTVGSNTATGPALKYDTVYMVSTFAGSAAGFADGTGTSALFNKPAGICTDADGNLYITDRSNNKIRKITAAGVVTTLAGSSQGFTNGPAATAQFMGLMGITRNAQGTIYVVDYNAHAVRQLTAAGTVSTVAGGVEGYAPGTTTTAKFDYPAGICLDANGTIYMTDAANSLIRYISGSYVNGLCGYACTTGYQDGTGFNALFNNPYGICVNAQGNFYVADTYGQKIRKVTPTGVVTTVAGSDMQGKKDGVGTAATFFQPMGICVDAANNLYVADTQNHLIRKIATDGTVTTIAGTGNAGKADGIGTSASFKEPYGICVDAQGTLYVADTYNHLIRKIVLQ